MTRNQLEKMELWLTHYEANGADSILPDASIVREMTRICTLAVNLKEALKACGVTSRDLAEIEETVTA